MTDLQQMIMDQEGLRLKVYLDSLGIETIGVGRNLRDKGISTDEAMILLNSDLCDALDDVRHCFSCYDSLSRPRQLVLIGLAFNLGREKLAKFVRFIGAIHRSDWNDAADELKNSKWYTQVGTRGVIYVKMIRENTSEWI
jgi:lysozyme